MSRWLYLIVLGLIAPMAWAEKQTGIADYCGPVTVVNSLVQVTVLSEKRTYSVYSEDPVPLELLMREVQSGDLYCIRGWKDYDDPNRIILYDFFPF